MVEIAINGRFRRQRLTGTQRVAHEITRRLKTAHVMIEPAYAAEGARGHAWEQLILPVRAGRRPIWSPCSTGPLAIRAHVVTIHDAAVLEHPEWFAPRFARFYGLLLPLLVKRAARIVTVSAFSRERLCERLGIPTDRIEVVWNGVGEAFRPLAFADDAALPAMLHGRPFFATLFTREPRKNLDLVLRAWRRARPQLPPETVLAVIGGRGAAGIFGTGMGDAENPSDGVVYCGYLPDATLPAILSRAWALLYPSLYEGFGLPALEAMACGTPAVVTARSSLPEICSDAALYVDAHDPDDLATMLRRLANDPALRSEHRRRGLERARHFTWERAAASMDAVFAGLG